MNSIFEFLKGFQDVINSFIQDLHQLVSIASGSIAILGTSIALIKLGIKAIEVPRIAILPEAIETS